MKSDGRWGYGSCLCEDGKSDMMKMCVRTSSRDLEGC